MAVAASTGLSGSWGAPGLGWREGERIGGALLPGLEVSREGLGDGGGGGVVLEASGEKEVAGFEGVGLEVVELVLAVLVDGELPAAGADGALLGGHGVEDGFGCWGAVVGWRTVTADGIAPGDALPLDHDGAGGRRAFTAGHGDGGLGRWLVL